MNFILTNIQNRTNQNKKNIQHSCFEFWINGYFFHLERHHEQCDEFSLMKFGFVHEISIQFPIFWNFNDIGFIAICRIKLASNSMSIHILQFDGILFHLNGNGNDNDDDEEDSGACSWAQLIACNFQNIFDVLEYVMIIWHRNVTQAHIDFKPF